MHLHEHTKTKLTIYTTEMKLPPVKPFMLVVASNIDHARGLEVLMSSPEFFGARYAGKVITVHSEGSGSEKDEIVEKLLTVEDPANPVEVVIHVNMLKEGWDVKNLYTIVPLRAANAKTLVEQTIGRGLRLPFGTRTGVPEVDQLTIVAHDKFDEIVTAAREGGLHFQQIVIGRDVPLVGSQAVPVPTAAQVALGLAPAPAPVAPPASASRLTASTPAPTVAPPVLTPEERRATEIAVNAMDQYRARLDSSADLAKPEVRAAMVKEVERAYDAGQQETIEGVAVPKAPDFNQIVARVAATETKLKIDIPRIKSFPVGEVLCGFHDFDLDASAINQQPNTGTIVSRDLSTDQERRLEVTDMVQERRLEDHLVHLLLEALEIDYNKYAKLLYKLSGQVVDKLRSYLPDEDSISNVLRAHRRTFVELIRAQMQVHAFEEVARYEHVKAEGFIRLDARILEAENGVDPLDYRFSPPEGTGIIRVIYGGFTKCFYPWQKFHSDPERIFSVVCERDNSVLKWMKPFREQLPIDMPGGRHYEPDFVVETECAKYLVEIKRRVDIPTAKVQANKQAATFWCNVATHDARAKKLKPWHYLLIPHDEVKEATDIAGYAAEFTIEFQPQAPSDNGV